MGIPGIDIGDNQTYHYRHSNRWRFSHQQHPKKRHEHACPSPVELEYVPLPRRPCTMTPQRPLPAGTAQRQAVHPAVKHASWGWQYTQLVPILVPPCPIPFVPAPFLNLSRYPLTGPLIHHPFYKPTLIVWQCTRFMPCRNQLADSSVPTHTSFWKSLARLCLLCSSSAPTPTPGPQFQPRILSFSDLRFQLFTSTFSAPPSSSNQTLARSSKHDPHQSSSSMSRPRRPCTPTPLKPLPTGAAQRHRAQPGYMKIHPLPLTSHTSFSALNLPVPLFVIFCLFVIFSFVKDYSS